MKQRLITRIQLLIAVCFALTLTALGTGSVLAKTTTPPTLGGEVLTGTVVHTNCTWNNPFGTSYTITWNVSGTASGPFNGTFQESGTATNPPTGEVTTAVTFQITANDGTIVKGTKTNNPPAWTGGTSCSPGFSGGIAGRLDYQAVINAGKKNSTYCDSGTSNLNSVGIFFQETFTSSQPATTRCKSK